MDNRDITDLNDVRFIARSAQERQGLPWAEHPLSRDPDEIWRRDDGTPAFVYIQEEPARIFAITRRQDPRHDELVEMTTLSPETYFSAYNRSGQRVDLVAVAVESRRHEP